MMGAKRRLSSRNRTFIRNWNGQGWLLQHRPRTERISTGEALKRALTLLIALLLIGATIETASTQPYPNRPIRIIIPFGPGGLADITTRLLGQKLAERTGEQVAIENRPSAGGIVAGNAVASAQPDGYTGQPLDQPAESAFADARGGVLPLGRSTRRHDNIPRSRHNPKILWIDDAEIVGNRIT